MLVILVIMTYSVCLFSQERLSTDFARIGIFGNYNFNSHNADFTSIPGCPNCSPGHEEGHGTGLALGALFEYPFSGFFRAGIRASYIDHSALLTHSDSITIFYSENFELGRFEHRFDAKIKTLGFEPYAQFRIISNLYVGVVVPIPTRPPELLL